MCFDKNRVEKLEKCARLTINLLHNKKQKLCDIFNVELRQSSKAFGNLRVQRQVNAVEGRHKHGTYSLI